MELAELAAYAAERYQMREERRWPEFPGFSVLTDARSGKWVALLMRQWDTETGDWVQRCDIRCGPVSESAPWLSGPCRMRGPGWVGLRIDGQTPAEAVFRLLDRAMDPIPAAPSPELWPDAGGDRVYSDTPLPQRPDAGGDRVYSDTPLPQRPDAGGDRVYSDTPLPPRPDAGGDRVYSDTPLPPRPDADGDRVYSDTLLPPQLEGEADAARPCRAGASSRSDPAAGEGTAALQRELARLIEMGRAAAESALGALGRTVRETVRETVPEALRQMRRLRDSGGCTPEDRARRFFRQGMRMQDYEDDLPWSGDFVCYYPCYQDLNTRQLRGYFTWRAGVRRGSFAPIPSSAAYLYLYELLNGIGAASPADSLDKLLAFERGYLDAGLGDWAMRANLRRWMLELAVLKELPPETALRVADPELIRYDADLEALRRPEAASDEEVFAALCRLGGKQPERSAVVKADPARAARLFSGAWRLAAGDWRRDGKTLFTACFGGRRTRRWYPLSNAVYWQPEPPGEREYVLDPCRSFRCRGGHWQVSAYERLAFDKALLQSFLHETELRLRRALRTGHYLKERPGDDWADPYVDAALAAERKAAAQAARPRLALDLSGLDRIRSDAALTRDSLLSEEEKAELAPPAPEDGAETPARYEAQTIRGDGAETPARDERETARGDGAETPARDERETARGDGAETPDRDEGETARPAGRQPDPAPPAPELPLDPVQRRILLALLEAGDAAEEIARARLTPALAADAVNEALFERFGDTVLVCEDETLTLLEDYRAELAALLEAAPPDAAESKEN